MTDPTATATVVTDPSLSGPLSLGSALVIAIGALAAVVVFLFLFFNKRIDSGRDEIQKLLAERAKERQDWAVERAKCEASEDRLRAEFELKHRELAERHAKMVKDFYDEAREHETLARREYTANMEAVAEKAREVQMRVGEVLDKAVARVTGSRRRD